MRKFINKLAIVSLIGLPIAAATAIAPAGASTGLHFKVVGVHSLTHANQPNTNIVGNASAGHFVPKKLTVAEDTSGNSCTTGFISFTVTNTGTKTAYVTYGGSVVFKLKKNAVEDICFYNGAAGEKATLGLSNKTGSTPYAGKLKITLSD